MWDWLQNNPGGDSGGWGGVGKEATEVLTLRSQVRLGDGSMGLDYHVLPRFVLKKGTVNFKNDG